MKIPTQVLLVFLLCSFSIPCKTQNLPTAILGVAEIETDSIYVKKIEKKYLNLIFDKSVGKNDLSKENFYKTVFFLNRKKTEYFRMNGKVTDTYWNQYFTVFKSGLGGINNKGIIKTSEIKFITDNGIYLGIDEAAVLKAMKNTPDCILEKGNNKIIKYYWFKEASLNYIAYNIPEYVSSFIFYKNRLIKFGFGEYLAELDPAFKGKEYILRHGKMY